MEIRTSFLTPFSALLWEYLAKDKYTWEFAAHIYIWILQRIQQHLHHTLNGEMYLSVSDRCTKTKYLKEFRTTTRIRLDALIAYLRQKTQATNMRIWGTWYNSYKPDKKQSTSSSPGSKVTYVRNLEGSPNGIFNPGKNIKYVKGRIYLNSDTLPKKKKRKITQRALHIFTNTTASQPGLPNNSNCHAHTKQQSRSKIFKHRKK